MIYLSGHIHDALAQRADAGWILTPERRVVPDLRGSVWAADNGCFTHPERFDPDAYVAWLRPLLAHRRRCLFVTAPDVVGDAAATLQRSRPMFARVRQLGLPVALVGQDGLESMDVPWDEFDAYFVGGSDSWKFSGPSVRLAIEADERGKWVHCGRVNSYRRLKACARLGFDSADGTYLVFGPDKNLPRLDRWLANINADVPDSHQDAFRRIHGTAH